MEVTLEDSLEWSGLGVPHCFNPYSNGSYSGRRVFYLFGLNLCYVSILILMEVTLEVSLQNDSISSYLEFQSLF